MIYHCQDKKPIKAVCAAVWGIADLKTVQPPIFLKTVDFFSDIEYNRGNISAKEERQWEYTLILTIQIFKRL